MNTLDYEEPVYHCICGETHRGEHAMSEWMQHNCYHEEGLVVMDYGLAYCVECGKSFRVLV